MDKRWLEIGVVVGAFISLTACTPYWHQQAQLEVCQHASDPEQCKERVKSGGLNNQKKVPDARVVLTDEELFKRAEKAREKKDGN